MTEVVIRVDGKVVAALEVDRATWAQVHRFVSNEVCNSDFLECEGCGAVLSMDAADSIDDETVCPTCMGMTSVE